MSQLIYLSRHGRTLDNQLSIDTGVQVDPKRMLMPGIEDLNDEGKKQASILGKYLKRELGQESLNIVSSTKPRAVQTLNIVVQEVNPKKYSGWSISGLREETAQVFIDDWRQEGKLANPDAVDQHRPLEEIGKDTYNCLRSFCKKKEDDAPLVVIGHAMRTISFMHYITGDIHRKHKRKFRMTNCGLYVLELDNDKFTVKEPHKTNEDLEKLLQAA